MEAHAVIAKDARSIISSRGLIAATASACIANTAWWMQPIIMNYLTSLPGFSESKAGILIAIEMGVMALAAAGVARFLMSWRLLTLALLGIAIAVGGSVVSLLSTGFIALALARGTVGVGMGALLTVSNTVAAAFPDPDKTFGRIGVINILFGAVIVAMIPVVSTLVPGASPYLTILMATLLLALPTALLPRDAAPSSMTTTFSASGGAPSPKPVSLNIVLLVLSVLMVGTASGAVWVFYVLIGQQVGLSMAAIDHAISLSIMGGIAAAGLAAIIGGRFGRIIPASISVSLVAVAVLVLASHPSSLQFRVAVCVNVGALYFLMPYLFGSASAQDETGRGAAYTGSAFFFTGAIGPAVASLLEATVGIKSIGILAVIAALMTIAVIIRVERAPKTSGISAAKSSLAMANTAPSEKHSS